MSLTLTVCRDYQTSRRYEYLVRYNGEIIARAGGYANSSAAGRAGRAWAFGIDDATAASLAAAVFAERETERAAYTAERRAMRLQAIAPYLAERAERPRQLALI